MIDMEKVEKGLNICTSKEPCNGCPYLNERNCSLSMVADALELLKAIENENARNPVIICPHCGMRVDDNLSDVYRKRVKDKLSSFYGIREDENNG